MYKRQLLFQLDEYYASLMDFEKEKAKAGLFMPSYAAEDVISQCREYISGEDGNFLLTIFPEKLETVPDLDNDMKMCIRDSFRFSHFCEGWI